LAVYLLPLDTRRSHLSGRELQLLQSMAQQLSKFALYAVERHVNYKSRAALVKRVKNGAEFVSQLHDGLGPTLACNENATRDRVARGRFRARKASPELVGRSTPSSIGEPHRTSVVWFGLRPPLIDRLTVNCRHSRNHHRSTALKLQSGAMILCIVRCFPLRLKWLVPNRLRGGAMRYKLYSSGYTLHGDH